MSGGYLESLVDLLLPRECVGCGQPGSALCGSCLGTVGPVGAHAPDPVPPGFPTCWSAGTYDGALRSAILAVKERERRELAPALGNLLLGAVVHAIAHSSQRDSRGDSASVLVPVSSTARAASARGGDHMLRIARAVPAVHGPRPVARLAHVLVAGGRSRDATELSAHERRVARSTAFGLRPGAAGLIRGREVVLLDDVVTTGWTLTVCAQLCRAAGASAVRAATIACTQRLRS